MYKYYFAPKTSDFDTQQKWHCPVWFIRIVDGCLCLICCHRLILVWCVKISIECGLYFRHFFHPYLRVKFDISSVNNQIALAFFLQTERSLNLITFFWWRIIFVQCKTIPNTTNYLIKFRIAFFLVASNKHTIIIMFTNCSGATINVIEFVYAIFFKTLFWLLFIFLFGAFSDL